MNLSLPEEEMIAYVETLREELQKTILRVVFTKKDGTKRTMNCTLNPDLIPADKMPKTVSTDDKESAVICVFETNLQEWRSFRKDSLIEWSVL